MYAVHRKRIPAECVGLVIGSADIEGHSCCECGSWNVSFARSSDIIRPNGAWNERGFTHGTVGAISQCYSGQTRTTYSESDGQEEGKKTEKESELPSRHTSDLRKKAANEALVTR